MFRKAFLLFLSSCIFLLSASMATVSAEDLKLPDSSPVATYKLGPGDVLEITVWKEEELTKQVILPPDGFITFPLADSFKAEGLTIDQVKDELVKRLSKTIVDPIVTVFLNLYASQKIYVIGKVNKPGEFQLTGTVDVMQALAMAGGMATFADEDSILILRRIDGKTTATPFDYSDVKSGDSLEQNIVLERGDVVVVP